MVAGPSADSLSYLCGGWTVNWQGSPTDDVFPFGTTVLAGVKAVAPGSEIVHRRGCDIDGNSNPNELEDTIAEARASDVVILAIGETHYAERFGDIDGVENCFFFFFLAQEANPL